MCRGRQLSDCFLVVTANDANHTSDSAPRLDQLDSRRRSLASKPGSSLYPAGLQTVYPVDSVAGSSSAVLILGGIPGQCELGRSAMQPADWVPASGPPTAPNR